MSVLSSSAGLVMVKAVHTYIINKQILFTGFFVLTYFLSTPNESYSIINTNTVHMHNLPTDDGQVEFTDVICRKETKAINKYIRHSGITPSPFG